MHNLQKTSSPPKLSRAEKSAKIRNDLLRAAAKIVGEVGYSKAMIAMITAEANVAQGTFYNYFGSRQDLFDQLLPGMGIELLAFIRAKASDAHNPVARERVSFLAFFEFLLAKPEFYRILYEAEMFAPDAFRLHMEVIASAYVRTLKRDFEKGLLNLDGPDEIEALAFSLMGARHYLCMRFARKRDRTVEIPPFVLASYMNLVEGGVFARLPKT